MPPKLASPVNASVVCQVKDRAQTMASHATVAGDLSSEAAPKKPRTASQVVASEIAASASHPACATWN